MSEQKNVYRILRKSALPSPGGVTGTYYAEVSALIKSNTLSAYCVPNELICGEIGRFLGLPIPPVGLMTYGPGPDVFFASMDFNITGVKLPPAEPASCVKALPSLSVGLVLFDILVANSDRHTGNLSLNSSTNPPLLSIYDQSHCLFGYVPNEGIARLDRVKHRLGISRGSVSGGNRHCLLDMLDNDCLKYFQEWVNRVKSIPDFFISNLCNQVDGLGVTTAELEKAKEFLAYRRDCMSHLLDNHRTSFSGLTEWTILI